MQECKVLKLWNICGLYESTSKQIQREPESLTFSPFLETFHCCVPLQIPKETNLQSILNSMSMNGEGILSEGFIQPPVDFIFSFTYPIQIFSIFLSAKIRNHCAQVISVYISDQPWTLASQNIPYFFHFTGSLTNLHSQKDNIGILWNPQMIKTVDPNSSQIKTSSFDFIGGHVSHYLEDPSIYKETFTKNVSLLKQVRSLKIRITKVRNSSSVGLQSIQIWANPMCSISLLQSITPMSSRSLISNTTSISPSSNSQEETLKIPHQFLDPITHEIMKNPVKTPSGKTVDRSTMEKHFQTYSTDPFTGKKMNFEALIPDRILQTSISTFQKKQAQKRRIDQISKDDFKTSTIPAYSPLYQQSNFQSSILSFEPNEPEVELNKLLQKSDTTPKRTKVTSITELSNKQEDEEANYLCLQCHNYFNYALLFKPCCNTLNCRSCVLKESGTCNLCNQVYKSRDLFIQREHK